MKQSGCSPARVSLPYSRPVFAGEHGLGDGQLVCDRGAADVLGDPCRYIQLVWKRQKLHNIHSQILTNAPPPAEIVYPRRDVPVCGGSERLNTSRHAPSRKEEL